MLFRSDAYDTLVTPDQLERITEHMSEVELDDDGVVIGESPSFSAKSFRKDYGRYTLIGLGG